MLKKFYFPLTVHVQERGCYDWSDGYTDHDGTYANMYAECIMDVIHNYCDEDMMEHFYYNGPVKTKLLSMFWTSEIVNGCLYGRVDVDISEDLTADEIEVIKDYICGQNSDGLGEGFEQHEIRVSYDEEIYVSFWNSGDDYWIYDEDEFNSKIRYNKQGGVDVGKKIIELTKCKPCKHHNCIICPGSKPATTQVNVQRLVDVRNDSLIIFYVCDECLAKMQNDIQKTCE